MKVIVSMLTGIMLMLVGIFLLLIRAEGAALVFAIGGGVAFILGAIEGLYGTVHAGSGGTSYTQQIAQKECPSCHEKHDMDYPRCPWCGHDYESDH